MLPRLLPHALLFLMAGALAAFAGPRPTARGDWMHTFEVPRKDRHGETTEPAIAHLWVPDDRETIRGILVAGQIRLEARLVRDAEIRQACADHGLAILFFQPHFSGTFPYHRDDSAERFLEALAEAARLSDRAELTQVPWLTMGHSTGGIFARNVAYWEPERMLGIIHLKSGNFQDHIPDHARSLAGIPLLSINGEFEEFGPAGGDLRGGLRSELSLHEEDRSKENQSQWILIRAQKLERRQRNPDNAMSLVVHRGGNHTNWSDDLTRLTAQFIRSCAARLPAEMPEGDIVRLPLIRAREGWLSDPDIKNPHHATAPYGDYTGDRQRAFWHVDEAIARAIDAYHRPPWRVPDPTADWPEEKRYAVPPPLVDQIDLPLP